MSAHVSTAGARGDVTDTDKVKWKLDRGTPYVPSPLLWEGTLYFLQSNNGIITAVDSKTGEPHYQQERLEGIRGVYASPVGVADRIYLGWPILAKRVRTIPEYGEMFVQAFDHIDRPEDVTIVHIANALGAFQNLEYRSFDSPFDAYLAGQTDALGETERRGLDLFYGKAGCSTCHSGPLLTDQEFHAIAIPPMGFAKLRRGSATSTGSGRASSLSSAAAIRSRSGDISP